MLFKILFVLLAPVRLLFGALIRIRELLLPARPQIARDPARQLEVDRETADLALYQMQNCPFCVKVRREITRLGLKIELRDVNRSPEFKKELIAGGGEMQVPCLRITENGATRWMYESSDINEYLAGRFGR